MRHILELTAEENLKFLDSFDLVLTDCDGVLWTIVGSISGSGDAINLLEACGKRIGYISNNSMRSDDEYKRKLKQIGVSVKETEDIIYPVKTIIRHFQNIKFDGLIYTIADDVFNGALRRAGYNVLKSENEVYRSQEHLATNVSVQDPVHAVILDIDINLNLGKLIKAQQYLKNDKCLFIMGASDKLIPLKKNFNVLGPAGFCNMLKEDSGKEPLILGKPGNVLCRFLMEHFQVEDPKRVLFIGDALIQDIDFGHSCGFQTMAVLSGATQREELLNHFREKLSPGFYADSMADFKEFFKKLNISNEIVKRSSELVV